MGERETMTDFTKRDYQHILAMMNGYSDPEDEIAASIRKKLVEQIKSMPDAEPEFFNLGDE
jgi:hypothetical protein